MPLPVVLARRGPEVFYAPEPVILSKYTADLDLPPLVGPKVLSALLSHRCHREYGHPFHGFQA